MIGYVVLHFLDTDYFKAAPFHSNDVVASQSEDGAMSDLCLRVQVLKPAALEKSPDQINEIELCEEICHALAPQASYAIQVHVKIVKENGVRDLEALQGLIDVW